MRAGASQPQQETDLLLYAQCDFTAVMNLRKMNLSSLFLEVGIFKSGIARRLCVT